MTLPTQIPEQRPEIHPPDRIHPESRLARNPWWWFVTAGALALILGIGFLLAIQLFALPLSFFLLGIAIAASLAPPVSWLARWMPRTLAVVLVYLILALVLVGIGWIIFPPLFRNAHDFGQRIPDLLRWLQSWIDQWNTINNTSLLDNLTSSFSSLGLGLLTVPITIYSAILDIVFVFFISLYALIVAPGIHQFILSLWPENRQQRLDRLVNEISNAMGGYVRGVIISGVIIGVLTYIGMRLIGIDYAVVLSVLAGVLEIVPILGPIISGVVVVSVALLQSPAQAFIALIFVVALQQTEGHIIFPNIMGRQTDMSPLLSIVAFVAGSAAGGLLGALVAIPVAAALHVFVMEVVAPMIRRWTGADVVKSV